MANPEHVAILKQGHNAWHEWRHHNPEIEPDLSQINLVGIELYNYDLRSVNFQKARLSRAHLEAANLNHANLSRADLNRAVLCQAKLRFANLSYTDLGQAFLDRADLYQTTLRHANLNESGLEHIRFYLTNLSNVQAKRARFRGSNFTHACIAGWEIDKFTDFTGVQCDAIYLGWNQVTDEPTDRFPHGQNDTFAPGEFVHFISQTRNLIELEFKKGVHWKAFLYSFQELQKSERYGELSVKGINRKSEQSLAVSIDAAITVNKTALEREFRVKYESMLNVKDRQIDSLTELLKIMAENQQGSIKQEFNAPVYGVTGQTETQVVNASLENVSG